MTSSEIRQSFLDFFKSKQHTIVPSSSLMPDAPNLLFTNAGMNQFVPIFLGQVKCPYNPPRAADTQKCIRAGGKHNDLEDVGLDTYHHTFFEMLGNWSFGDYFKREAIDWAWELVVKTWGFPAERIYGTVFCPYHGEPGWDKKWATELEQVLALAMTTSEFIPPNPNASPFEIADQEAALYWAKKFTAAGRDPKIHIIPGNKKDNFWMMGETGPCGPCSEIHVDLTAAGNTRGMLVNKGDARCIEIWNLVFIQFNAEPDGPEEAAKMALPNAKAGVDWRQRFVPLPSKHVDTGMGFERVTSIIQGTKEFKDFANAKISNYETDIFRPIFDGIEKQCGKKYGSTLPTGTRTVIEEGKDKVVPAAANEAEAKDVAFRVIADHIRTLSFAIADGIQPGNTDRNYVLRRILRRALRYGRTLGFHEPFFYKLVDVLASTMGDVFPEIRAKKKHVQDVIRTEEDAFNKTLDKGLSIFEQRLKVQPVIDEVTEELHKGSLVKLTREDLRNIPDALEAARPALKRIKDRFLRAMRGPKATFDGGLLKIVVTGGESLSSDDIAVFRGISNVVTQAEELLENNDAHANFAKFIEELSNQLLKIEKALVDVRISSRPNEISGSFAFALYDTYGFPLDLTELMARERGLTVDVEGFNKLMGEQKSRARAAQKKEVVELSQTASHPPTKFIGYDSLETPAKVLEVVSLKDKTAVVLDSSTLYAEMGGQVGDTGEIILNPVAADVSRLKSPVGADSRPLLRVVNTQKSGNTWLHIVEGESVPAVGTQIVLRVDKRRRNSIERHHTVTHLLHWALHEVVTKEASQKGSFVGPEKLTFDFNSAPLTPQQVADIEKLVNERIVENAGVSWTEVPYADVKSRKDVMQFFGDKYGEHVRVVQIGGDAKQLNGYSMELCGGTHTRATGEIGLFRITGENAIAAGVRRIEAVAGLTAYDLAKSERELIKTVAGKLNSPVHELEKKIEALLAQQKELEKQAQIALQRNASNAASELVSRAVTVNGIPLISHNLGDADANFLQAIADSLKGRFKGVVVLGGGDNGAVSLVATVSAEFTSKVQAGKLIQAIAPIVGGKGGGKPDNARGGGKDAGKLDEALAKVKSLLG